jgi:CMP/dCMP kinase
MAWELKLVKGLVIAFDGPAASGKGTLASKIAAELGLPFMDTGLLYRAMGHILHHQDLTIEAASQFITTEFLQNPQLRSREAGERASIVGAISEVRIALLAIQKTFAASDRGAVLDGRDIGTVIAPKAPIKFFITASPEVRAQRRFLQLSPFDGTLKYEDVLSDIKRRDERDQGRSQAPLIMAKDAHLIDTSEMSIDEATEAARAWVRLCCGSNNLLGSNQNSGV